MAAFHEHKLNLWHKDNRHNLLNSLGGEADVRAVAENNVHKLAGQIQ